MMSSEETPKNELPFWETVTKYTESSEPDEPFVNEVSYMMVTLHRCGA